MRNTVSSSGIPRLQLEVGNSHTVNIYCYYSIKYYAVLLWQADRCMFANTPKHFEQGRLKARSRIPSVSTYIRAHGAELGIIPGVGFNC